MKRISKREMEFRFDLIDEARVKIHRIERGDAVAVLEGVECRLESAPSERLNIAKPGTVRAWVSSYPKKIGDGSPPKGTKPNGEAWDGFLRQPADRQIRLHSHQVTLDQDPAPYEAFVRRHPVGTLVEAEVVRMHRYRLHLRFDDGLTSTISVQDCWDRWPQRPRKDPSAPRFPHRIEVIVRSVIPARNLINVSMHGYPHDAKYCNAAAGYRSAYDAREGRFRLLPWERK